jgi:hypothetical protein
VHIGQAIDVDLLPFDEVAVLDGVQGVQLVDLGLAGDVKASGSVLFRFTLRSLESMPLRSSRRMNGLM